MLVALTGALVIAGLAIMVTSPLSQSHAATVATISLNPTQATVGAVVQVSGSGWVAGDTVIICLDSSTIVLARVTVASDGTLKATITVPVGVSVGAHVVVATDVKALVIAKATLTILAS